MENEILDLIQKYIDFKINLDSHVKLIGINSLKMMMIKWDIERTYDVEITYEDLVSVDTIRDFVKIVEKYKRN
ncbi:acyl carrier protein [bacterium]|nr:acyl carrier protein [bacterium]